MLKPTNGWNMFEATKLSSVQNLEFDTVKPSGIGPFLWKVIFQTHSSKGCSLARYVLCPKSVVWCVPPTLKLSTCWWTWNFRWRIGKNHGALDSWWLHGCFQPAKSLIRNSPYFTHGDTWVYPWKKGGFPPFSTGFSTEPAFATGALKVQVDHVCGAMAGNFGQSGWW